MLCEGSGKSCVCLAAHVREQKEERSREGVKEFVLEQEEEEEGTSERIQEERRRRGEREWAKKKRSSEKLCKG